MVDHTARGSDEHDGDRTRNKLRAEFELEERGGGWGEALLVTRRGVRQVKHVGIEKQNKIYIPKCIPGSW